MSDSAAINMGATAPRRGRSRSKARADEISVVEAAYRLDGTETEWLEGIASAAAPLLDEGLGIAASTWTAAPGTLQVQSIAALGGPAGFSEAVGNAVRRCDPRITLGMLRVAPCTSLNTSGTTELVEADASSQNLLRMGVRDCLAILGVDSGRYVTALISYRPYPTRPSRQVISRWSRVASHLAAGFRVRRGLADLQERFAGPNAFTGSEAIFTATGRLEHVENPAEHARKTLAHAVLAMNRARGNLRTDDPDAALDAWQGLVAGRWSLLDHIDTDGKRFLIARKNAPDTAGPEGLSLRERQVLSQRARGLALKLIAYDLGLSIAGVSKSLQTGMAKLGLSCEAEIVALFSAQP
jgi:DNA-binding CsgD family transcriptional regulator